MNVLVLSSKQGLQGPCFISQVLLDELAQLLPRRWPYSDLSVHSLAVLPAHAGHSVNFRILSQLFLNLSTPKCHSLHFHFSSFPAPSPPQFYPSIFHFSLQGYVLLGRWAPGNESWLLRTSHCGLVALDESVTWFWPTLCSRDLGLNCRNISSLLKGIHDKKCILVPLTLVLSGYDGQNFNSHLVTLRETA